MEEKDRLTKKEPCWENEEFWISAEEPDESKIDEIYLKLRDYEDTNLSPQEVEQLKKENEELKSSQNNVAVEKSEKVKRELFVQTQYGRILMPDKDTEFVGLRYCENCKQKDQRIAELETNLRETLDMVKNSNYKEVLEENGSLGNSLNISAELNKKYKERIAELEKQLAANKLALLKACQELIEQAEEALKKAEER